MRHVAGLLGVGTPETIRKWCRQVEVDTGRRPGVSANAALEVKRENAERRRANGILKAASASFGAELDRPQR